MTRMPTASPSYPRLARLACALALAAAAPAGCIMDELSEDEIAELEAAGGGRGGVPYNGVPPTALTRRHLRKGVTDGFGITGAAESRPLQLIGYHAGTWGEIRGEWASWRGSSYPTERGQTLAALIHCALPADYEVRIPGFNVNNPEIHASWRGTQYDRIRGGMGLVPGWRWNRLTAAQQEMVSGCVMALINANGVHVNVSFVTADPSYGGGLGQDSSYKYMEAVFYGNLFWSSPSAIVCGGERYSEDGGIVIGRVARICGDSSGACGFSVMGDCPGSSYVQGEQGYCLQWSGSGANRYCVRARDDGSKTWWYPTTTHLDVKVIERPGAISKCGPSGGAFCEL